MAPIGGQAIEWGDEGGGNTAVWPDPSEVLKDVVFGAEGELVGTLEPTGFPTLTARDITNQILAFIGASSLTDDEWDSIDIDLESAAVEVYAALDSVLQSREAVSSQRDRLKYYFQAKGVEVEQPAEIDETKSKIFIGADLCSEIAAADLGKSRIFLGGEL